MLVWWLEWVLVRFVRRLLVVIYFVRLWAIWDIRMRVLRLGWRRFLGDCILLLVCIFYLFSNVTRCGFWVFKPGCVVTSS